MGVVRKVVNKILHPGELRVSLALGGGAARGIAHIGVLKVIDELGITVEGVAGTSVGAIIGSLYCKGYSWKEIWDVARELSWGELVKLSFSGMGLAKTNKLEELLRELLDDREFSQLDIPLKVVTVDIASAEEVVLDSGNVARAALASASIPGIFEPVEMAWRFLVDGGVSNNVPCDVARSMGGGTVVAVDLNAEASEREAPKNMVDVTLKTFAILMWNTSNKGRAEADILIQPATGQFRYHDLDRAEELLKVGEEAARRILTPYV
ncbi:MAG: patatin-like phospholipase family protein [Hydrogenovibrio crunogenus]|nr:patatin-like phospholipase family protein [Hydrogenovibrio crunogenus]